MTASVLERNYKALLDLVPGLRNAEVGMEWRFETPRGVFMPWTVEVTDQDDGGLLVSMDHHYEQNWDLMWDPRLDVWVNHELGVVSVLSYTQSNLGIYHERPEDASWTGHVWDCDRFLETWLKNIKCQGHKLRRGPGGGP